MLLRFVKSNLREGRSVKSDSDSVADNDCGKEKLVKDGSINSSESSAVGSSELSIFLNPARLDLSVRNDESGLLQLLLKIGDELFVSGSKQNLVGSVADDDKDKRFILFVGDFLDFVDEDGLSKLLVFSVEVTGGFDEGGAYLVFEVREVGSLSSFGSFEDVVNFSGIGHCGKSDIY